MRRMNFRVLVALVIGAVSIFSCAEQDDTILETDYYTSFDLWAAKNYPHLTKVDTVDGLYWKFNHVNPNTPSASKELPNDSTYLYVELSTRSVDGTYMVNTDPDIARQLGSFSYQTRYVPFKFRLRDFQNYYGLTTAHFYALKNMEVGDEVEILAAPAIGYNYTADVMYQGFDNIDVSDVTTRTTLGIFSTVASIKIKLVDMIQEADAAALVDVINYAESKSDAVSVKSGLYIFDHTKNSDAADSLRTDSTLQIKYTGRFMDNFVFDTNDEEVAIENHIYDSSKTYGTMAYTYNKQDTTNYGDMSAIEAFQLVLGEMRLGEKLTFITSPTYAYGESGQYPTTASTGGKTLIYTQTPLIFTVEIIKEEEE